MTKKQNIWQIVKFVLFSASAGIIEILSFTLLLELLGVHETISTVIATILSRLWNFTFNRRYTFQSVANVPVSMCKIALYYCLFMIPFKYGMMYLLATTCGWNEYLVEAMTMLVNLVTEFLYCRFVVYRNNMNNNDIAKKQRKN